MTTERDITAAYEFTLSQSIHKKRQKARAKSIDDAKQAILKLRQVTNPEQRVAEIIKAAALAPDDAEVRALAEAEINAAFEGRGAGISRRAALLKLQPPPSQAPARTPAAASEPTSGEHLPPGFWCDSEEPRLVRALYGIGAALVLGVSRQQTRTADGKQRGSGKVLEEDVIQCLKDAGIKTSAKTIHDRWIKPFVGILWGYSPREKVLFPYAQPRRTSHGNKGRLDLVRRALDSGRSELVETNLPGEKYVYFVIQPTLKANCGELLKVWLNGHKDPRGHFGLAMFARVFGATEKTVRGWLRCAGIKPMAPHFAEFAHGDPHLNADRARHAHPILIRSADGIILRWRLQWTHRYIVPESPKREHRCNPRERRRAARHTLGVVLSSDLPNAIYGEARTAALRACVGSRPPRIHFEDKQTRKGIDSAHQQIRRALRKSEDYSHPYTAALGIDRRYRCNVVEVTTSAYPQTYIGAQLPRKQEEKRFAAYGGRQALVQMLQESVAGS